MITVATSGGPPKADPSWCEKYPDDVDCQGGDPLPMLLTVPRIGDYQGGASLLGLGDIVLPGLLLSFAARLDAAKRLLGVISGGSGANAAYTCREDRCGGAFTICNGGYFAPLVIAYAVGLLMANTAVYVMQMGQPALLYLVPCCLGTICYMGWRRNELLDLWNGPKVIRTADTLLYGEGGHDDPGLSELPTEEGLEAPAAPSAQDEQVDEAIMSSP
jgi:signal peptide peptidase-like protein 2B